MSGKKILLLLSAFLFFYTHSGRASGQTPETSGDVFFFYEPALSYAPAGNISAKKTNMDIQVSADAAVLMDADTGQLLYAKNPHQPRPIASTTKIMTALLAI
ncbi:MAG: hypothetical protein ACOY4I_16105 [Bacillota bacterium]